MGDISLEDKKPEILRAIEYAKTKGVTAIKVELEASLRRNTSSSTDCGYCNEGDYECEDCYDGLVECNDCVDGWTTDTNGDDVRCASECDDGRIRCDECEGSGRITCHECDGDWQGDSEDNWDDQRCMAFLLDYIGISDAALQHDTYDDRLREYHYNPEYSDWLQFARFYNDGSVDSEMTYTVRLDNPENIFKALELVEGFKALAEAIGNGMNTDGAGMHMAWVFDPDCRYPSGHEAFTSRQINNFRKAINQMMPALFFLAAPSNGKNWTRGFNYRNPTVGLEGSKYSAIYYCNGAMEFRVFDTCYDTPEQLLDNAVVMSNCLKYAVTRYIGPTMFRDRSSYGFGNDNSRTLDRLYYEENSLDLLYQHIDKLKPKYYTLRMLRKQRGFTVTKSGIKKRKETMTRNAELAWQEFEDRWNVTFGIRIKEAKYNFMRSFAETATSDQLRSLDEAGIAELVRERLERHTRDMEERKPVRERYILDHTQRQENEYQPQYRVYLA